MADHAELASARGFVAMLLGLLLLPTLEDKSSADSFLQDPIVSSSTSVEISLWIVEISTTVLC
jgi:hypothetical protein